MYGLPPQFDATFLMGRTLEAVSFTSNTVTLCFDNDILITLLSSFEYADLATLESSPRVRVPVKQSNLMELIDRQITSVEGDKLGTLTLEFDRGSMLRLFDDSSEYESYRIAHGAREIIV
jgi:hypothetical protein